MAIIASARYFKLIFAYKMWQCLSKYAHNMTTMTLSTAKTFENVNSKIVDVLITGSK